MESLKKISVVNRNAYNLLADNYQENWRQYLVDEAKMLEPFEKILRETFAGVIRVLDAGCGVGLNSHLLSEHGFEVTGVDFAENMIRHAKANAPKAKIVHSDFMRLREEGQFEGLVSMAFVHLFPKAYASRVVKKIRSLLAGDGVGLFVTTASEKSDEGYYEKSEYDTRVKRFRKFWTQEEFLRLLEFGGLGIVDVYMDSDSVFDKRWLNVIVKKSRRRFGSTDKE